jgi:histidinol phosphatase-like enzyme (inositol monophosphatase family)
MTDLDVAELMADAARSAILPLFRQDNLETENKSDSDYDPVTRADRAAESAMREILAQHRPEDGVWGEEFGRVDGPSGRLWVLDPIDGTRGFVAGTPTWGVLIALTEGDGPILGVIDQPYIQERFIGAADRASLSGPLGQRPLRVRTTTELGDAVIFTTFPEVGTQAEGEAFHRVAQACRLTRYGMDCYAYALLAAGQVDLVIEAGLSAYDIMAPVAVIEAAGGIVTDWSGGPAYNGGRALAAATPQLHERALALLSAP